jgi:Rrf2 family protein
MKLSAKSEYACVATLELAAAYGTNEPVRIRKIADQHGIPSRFLVQILLQLKGAGIVVSTRGALGGYQLARAPHEISLGEVMSVIEGPDELPPCCVSADSRAARVLRSAWNEVIVVQHDMLAEVSFGELLDRAREAESMYYI